MTIQTNAVLGGGMTGAILGAAFGILASRPSDREDNAKHYALLLGAVGAVVGGLTAGPSVQVTA